MSQTILVLILIMVIAISAAAIGSFYLDYVHSLQASLNSGHYDVSILPK